MPVSRIPANVGLSCRDTALTKGKIMRNVFIDTDENGNPIAIKRPALVSIASIPSSHGMGRGVYYRRNTRAMDLPSDWNNKITYSGADTSSFQYNFLTYKANLKGQFVGAGIDVSFAENNNSANWQFGLSLGSTTSHYSYAITYDWTNSRWWVVDYYDQKAYYAADTDLTSWTDNGAITVDNYQAYDMTYCPGATNYLCVVGQNQTNLNNSVLTSPDGATWTAYALSTTGYAKQAVCADDTYFLAVGGAPTTLNIHYSSNGTSWTDASLSGSWYTCAVQEYNNGASSRTWITAGNAGKIARARSTIPSTFTDVTPTGLAGYSAIDWRCAFACNQFKNTTYCPTDVDFLVGGTSGKIVYSTDQGATWAYATFPEETDANSINIYSIGPIAVDMDPSSNSAYKPMAYGFVAYATTAGLETVMSFTSRDGKTWYAAGRYNPIVSVDDNYISLTTPSDLTVNETYEFDYYITSLGSSSDTKYGYTKAYFAELFQSSNSVLGIQVGGNGISYYGTNRSRGGMAFCINNSPPMYFHGTGEYGNANRMSYPWDQIKGDDEWMANGIVALDGYFFIMTSKGNIYHCAAGDPFYWPALNVINAQLEGDRGIGIAKHQNNIVAFGDYTTEFFYDNANPVGSVLNRREDVRYHVGLACPNTMDTYEDMTMFIGRSKENGLGVYVLINYQLTKISNYTIDNLLQNYLDLDLTDLSRDDKRFKNAVATFTEYNGHIIYLLTMMNSSSVPITMAYDLMTKLWFNWYQADRGYGYGSWLGTTGAGTDFIDGIGFTVDAHGNRYLMTTSALTYVFDKSAFKDYSAYYANNYIECIVQSGQRFSDDKSFGNRKRYLRCTYLGDETASSETVAIDWSDDDYQSWTTGWTVDLSDGYMTIKNLGTARRRAWRMTHTANSDFRFEGLEIEYLSHRH